MILQLASLFSLCLTASVPTPDYYDYSENYEYKADPAYKLSVVCDGFGTDMVHCKYIPFLEELRTAQQQLESEFIQ